MRIFLPFQPAGFDLCPHDAQGTHPGVAHVRKDHFPRTASRHHLVVDQVGGGACQGQVALVLPDDLMPGGKRDQVGETRCIHQVAIPDVLAYSLFKRDYFRHNGLASSCQ